MLLLSLDAVLSVFISMCTMQCSVVVITLVLYAESDYYMYLDEWTGKPSRTLGITNYQGELDLPSLGVVGKPSTSLPGCTFTCVISYDAL